MDVAATGIQFVLEAQKVKNHMLTREGIFDQDADSSHEHVECKPDSRPPQRRRPRGAP